MYNASGRPTTSFTLDNAPGEAVAAILNGAMYKALQTLLLDSNLWNNRFIWAGPDITGNAGFFQQNINSLMGNHKADFDKSTDNKPRSFVKPRGITSAHRTMQQRVTAYNALSFIGGY